MIGRNVGEFPWEISRIIAKRRTSRFNDLADRNVDYVSISTRTQYTIASFATVNTGFILISLEKRGNAYRILPHSDIAINMKLYSIGSIEMQKEL